MGVTKISDLEAAKLIGRNYLTIRSAAERGDLTRFPKQGSSRQYVCKEQLELFRGKYQLKADLLDEYELEAWYGYREEILSIQDVRDSSIDLDALADKIANRLIRVLVSASPMSASTGGISSSDVAGIALSGLAAGLVTYGATKNRNLSIATGITASAIVILIGLYQRGEIDRSLVEDQLSQLPEQEQVWWRPLIDNPSLLEEKLSSLVMA